MWISEKSLQLVLISPFCYPFGGGEAYLLDSARWIQQEKGEPLTVLWFGKRRVYPRPDAAVKTSHPDVWRWELPNLTVFCVDGMPPDRLMEFMELFPPSPHAIAHIQGVPDEGWVQGMAAYGCHVVFGFHFWTGAVEREHRPWKLSPFIQSLSAHTPRIYVVSEYMRDVLKSVGYNGPLSICYNAPSPSARAPSPYDPARKWILFVDPTKNPMVLDAFVQRTKLPVCVVGCSVNELTRIARLVPKRPDLELHGFVSNMGDYYARARLVCSFSPADETFSRVTLEAMTNGVPILTYGHGFVRQLLGDTVALADTHGSTVSLITSWYHKSPKELCEISAAMKARADTNFSEAVAKAQFLKVLRVPDTPPTAPSTKKRYAIVCPWADQGLGIQARHYVQLLERYRPEWEASIFSFVPYFAATSKDAEKRAGITDCMRYQCDPAEWVHPRVYYSPNIREGITAEEIRTFIHSYHPQVVLIPEVEKEGVFFIARTFRRLGGCKVYAIPNIEICRESELSQYPKAFHACFCNNEFSKRILATHMPKGYPLPLLRFAMPLAFSELPNPVFDAPDPALRTPLRFLHLSGNNGVTRKYTAKICEAFAAVAKRVKDRYAIELTIVTQASVPEAIKWVEECPFIHHTNCAIPYRDVQAIYGKHHIVIHTSKEEGLGLGFYEALAHGCPVISLKGLFYPEIVRPGVNGWLVPAKPLEQGEDRLIRPLTYNKEDLETVLESILKEGNAAFATIRASTKISTMGTADPAAFAQRLSCLMDGTIFTVYTDPLPATLAPLVPSTRRRLQGAHTRGVEGTTMATMAKATRAPQTKEPEATFFSRRVHGGRVDVKISRKGWTPIMGVKERK